MNREEGKSIVEKLINDFEQNESHYKSKDFQETEVRNRFIDPFFSALGWNFFQTDIHRNEWDVYREYSQRDNSSTKKPDYAFRVNDGHKFKVKFFVEAKAPWVKLTDHAPVYQAKRYAFSSHGKSPIVILTDFQEFRVFNGLQKPVFDNPYQGLIKGLDLVYTDYISNWDKLWSLFSKEAVCNGSINELIGNVSKNTKTLDEEFLSDISRWREILAKNVALRNKALEADELNEAVQRIIDRLVFIRNLEDREIEPEGTILAFAKIKEKTYQHLIPLFRNLDSEYNGLLFKEHYSEKLIVDDKVIKDLIKDMCFPFSPYQFDQIEPEILGRIYEQFLGSKIRLTESHQAKVEEKPEVRKAGGVYYTPQYIVDHVVKNTVGKSIEGHTPEEISNVKICDPACGSGSFLLGAFDYIMDYHKAYYAQCTQSNQKKYKADFYFTAEKDIKLTLKKKAEILKNNIFGVDIDREATEVAIMSLYLKLLDEGFDKRQVELFLKGHILPDMTGNIKCGNSVIGNDYFMQNLNYSKEDFKRINPFDWEKEFSHKFSIVIGNPPWISLSGKFGNDILSKNEIDYLIQKYKANTYMPNMYEYFIAKGLELISLEGSFSFIVPDRFGQNDQFIDLRKKILNNYCIKELIYKAEFPGVIADTLIFLIEKNNVIGNYSINVCEYGKEISIKTRDDYLKDPKYTFSYSSSGEVDYLLQKIENGSKEKLGDVFETTSGFGGNSKKLTKERISEKQIPIYRGRNVERYFINGNYFFEFIKTNITGRTTDINKLGATEKILLRKTGYPLFACFDNSGIFPEQSVYFLFNKKSSIPYEFYLAIINSMVFQFYYWNKLVTNRDSTPQIKKIHLDMFPFPSAKNSNSDDISSITKLVHIIESCLKSLREAKSEKDITIYQKQIDMADNEITNIIYRIYELNANEIILIEK